jgi:hypothetical protein
MKAIAIVPGLNLLYVTTATEHWTEEQPRAEPKAGIGYRLQTEATGLAAARLRLHLIWWATAVWQGCRP